MDQSPQIYDQLRRQQDLLNMVKPESKRPQPRPHANTMVNKKKINTGKAASFKTLESGGNSSDRLGAPSQKGIEQNVRTFLRPTFNTKVDSGRKSSPVAGTSQKSVRKKATGPSPRAA